MSRVYIGSHTMTVTQLYNCLFPRICSYNLLALQFLSHPSQRDRLNTLVLCNAIFASLTSKPGILHSPERRSGIRYQPGVHTYHPRLHCLSYSVAPLDIFTEKVSGQSDISVVRHGDDFGLRIELEKSRHGTKGFLMRQL